MSKRIDMTGKKYGKWTVISSVGNNDVGQSKWLCECECGKRVIILGYTLRQGSSRGCKTCGLKTGNLKKIKHGDAFKGKTERLYTIWLHMKARCLNKNSCDYKYYGGKGVCIYNEWKDYKLFKDWAIIFGYKNDLTIDRINSNGNYEPSNCQWVTLSENIRRRNYDRANHSRDSYCKSPSALF